MKYFSTVSMSFAVTVQVFPSVNCKVLGSHNHIMRINKTYSAMQIQQGQARQVYSEVSCWFLRMMALLRRLLGNLVSLGLILQKEE